jgi:hypothetical protein
LLGSSLLGNFPFFPVFSHFAKNIGYIYINVKEKIGKIEYGARNGMTGLIHSKQIALDIGVGAVCLLYVDTRVYKRIRVTFLTFLKKNGEGSFFSQQSMGRSEGTAKK